MSAPGTLRTIRPDPLQQRIPLPFRAELYPLGFRLEVETNSRDVLEAAREAWAVHTEEFACEPIRLRVIVEGGASAPGEPCFRGQGSMFTIVSDRDNFAALDALSFSGFCFTNTAAAANHAWFRWFFLESSVYLLLSQRYVVPVHAACVAKNGKGVLLCGRSEAGKSTLAYACARTGWTYVCDDATFLQAHSSDRVAIGRPHIVRFREDAPTLFPELCGHAVRVRPNGRAAIEVPLAAFHEIRTATRCRIENLVLLDRKAKARAKIEAIDRVAAVRFLLSDLPSYGEEVNGMHEATIRQLEHADAWRLTYENLEEAVAALSALATQ